ncbi:LysR family transcriptional regulator [Citrobacter amalonaticus]|uniref:LysR family transcriptional regulator n=1 Tax=Citrobacter amalonaticus TaxID=35703 RepID=A0A2S4RS81_CITAM|nr:LysR family transcriptional regulator [Citrobacter amalonaticus]POT55707.1 LysR family transcriptional regulator [Citrobacter amalonaticus]POT73920.1 LysR family transcriptional regulator [Citrobacter amalonaticus]POU62307.1 LysR family transcriptional regulator [Citrobacter amalonaticus]POV02809.1 LysR family transcriptional regulator [Citrobacter amalonaticus]
MAKEDLNLQLLQILCALVETKSATLTSIRLDLGNSAITYALNKLRNVYNDPLMIRSKNGMQPTLLALELYSVFKPALLRIEEGMSIRGTEYLLKERKGIYIRCSSFHELILTFRLFENEINPRHAYVFLYNALSPVKRLEALRRRQVDIDIGSKLEHDQAISQYPLPVGQLMLLCKPDHPRVHPHMTISEMRKEKVLTCYMPSENISRDIEFNEIDHQSQLDRPYFSTSISNILTLVAHTEAVCLVPIHFARFACNIFNLKSVECHLPNTNIMRSFYIHIHHSQKNEPALKEIIDLIQAFGRAR